MNFKRLRTQLFIKLLISSAAISLAINLMLVQQIYVLPLMMLTAASWFMYTVAMDISKHKETLSHFAEAVRLGDFSRKYNASQLDGDGSLADALNSLSSSLKSTNLKQQQQQQLLNAIVQQLGVGIILLNASKELTLYNPAAKRLLGFTNSQSFFANLELEELLTPLMQQGVSQLTAQYRDNALKFTKTSITLGPQHYQLIIVDNIQQALDAKELDAWQKLIRILVHEISNSVTPVNSLANTALSLIPDELDTDLDWQQDVKESLNAIARRSLGLVNYVHDYRKLAHLAPVSKDDVNTKALLENQVSFIKQQHPDIDITCEVKPAELIIKADENALEQVLVNLLLNSVHACHQKDQDQATITLSAYINDYGKPVIEIKDTGCGISATALPKIFTPFFTTKPKGSGIGLALSKQVMYQHGGDILVESTLGQGTCFKLIF